jgi:adenylate kinase family enzyme
VYEDQTASLVAFYDERALLCRVDASRSPDEVTQDVRKCLAA